MVINIGVLALQGSVKEHIYSLSRLDGITPLEVKSISDLEKVSGLILPGGESTTIGKLLKGSSLAEPIVKKAKEGMPVWGTCAGMILMAKEIVGENYSHLGIMHISVRRNAYGNQLDSFSSKACMPEISREDIPLVFIRAPWVEKTGKNVRVLCKVAGNIAAVREDNMLATSFHPELTESLYFHRYFAEMVEKHITCIDTVLKNLNPKSLSVV